MKERHASEERRTGDETRRRRFAWTVFFALSQSIATLPRGSVAISEQRRVGCFVMFRRDPW